MTVSTTDSRKQYTGDGVTVSFSFPYLVFADVDIVVTTTVIATGISTTQVLNGAGTYDYSLTGTFDAGQQAYLSGVSVVLLTALPATHRVTIERIVAVTQPSNYIDGDGFPAETFERSLDRLTIIAQQLNEIVGRGLNLPGTSAAGDVTLPTPVANNIIAWNAAADDLENKVAADIDLATVTAFVSTLLDDPDAATVRATLLAGTAGDAVFLAETEATARAAISALENVLTTQGDMVRQGASGAERFTGTVGQIPRWNGTTIVASAQINVLDSYRDITGGSSYEWTNVPTWARTVELLLDEVSLSGTDAIEFQVGPVGAIQETGYTHNIVNSTGTQTLGSVVDAFPVALAAGASNVVSGVITLRQVDASTPVWSYEIVSNRQTSDQLFDGHGRIALTGALTRVLLRADGSDTFDGSSKVTVRYY